MSTIAAVEAKTAQTPASQTKAVAKKKAERKGAHSTLDRLRNAARALFVARGYHETRPQDIARDAGVASGTFYLHFNDKQQAFLDFAEQAQNELLGQLTAALAGIDDRRDRLKAICNAVLNFGQSHPGLLQAAFVDPVFIAPNDENAWRMYDRLGQLVSLALRDEVSSNDYDLELISHGLCGLLRQAMIYASRKDFNREKMVEDLSLFIDQGLGRAQIAKEESL